jgi:hypothetical protein
VVRSGPVTPTAGIVSTFDAQIPIAAGEYIGIECCAGPEAGDFFRASTESKTDVWSPLLAEGSSPAPTEVDRAMEALVSANVEPDIDGDGLGETEDLDDDGDGLLDGPDNCDAVANPGQEDSDGDLAGDACDTDRDNDGVPNSADVCPGLAGSGPDGCPVTQSTRVNTPAIVRFRTPLARTAIGRAQLVELDVVDDFGSPVVTVFDDDGTVCTVSAAPYSCTWNPTGADVGRATLLASAVDADNRSSLASVRVRVARFKGTLTQSRRGRRVSGRLRLPAAVERSLGCRGKVTVRRGKVRRTTALKRNCTYAVRLPAGRGRVRVSFAGNPVVAPT